MFAFPAARVRAGINHSLRFALPALSILCLQAVAYAADTQAEAVLKKMQTLYQTAKTYKGTIKSLQSGKTPDGKAYTVTQTQQIRYKTPNLFWVRLSMAGTGAAAKANGSSQTVACDGKSLYQYLSARNQYMKQPAPPSVPPMGPANLKLDLSTAKMLPASNVAGKPAYIIQVEQAMPPNIPPDKQAQVKPLLKVNVAVDKSNYYLLRITRPNGENASEFTEQSVNGALASNAFTFVPPAGATLATRPANPGASGAPGAPGLPPKR